MYELMMGIGMAFLAFVACVAVLIGAALVITRPTREDRENWRVIQEWIRDQERAWAERN